MKTVTIKLRIHKLLAEKRLTKYRFIAMTGLGYKNASRILDNETESIRFSTIARINEKMWAELFLWNKENLIAEIDQFDSALDQLRDALVTDDRDKLEEMFRLSTQRRAAFDKKDS